MFVSCLCLFIVRKGGNNYACENEDYGRESFGETLTFEVLIFLVVQVS